MDTTAIKAEADALRDELIARRRDLHQHPELAFEEFRTSGIVARELTALGLEVRAGVGRTGVVGLLEGATDGPTVLVRADMDALPILEENRTDYTSADAGKMHACGHDAHTTIALGVAKILAGQRDQMAGRVKFVFQPAEEIAGGARAMVADGVLDDPRPDVSLGLHVWNSLPLGKVGAADGAVMSGASRFTVRITGKGGHAASPHLGVDPVVCAAHVVTALQSIVSRSVDPFESAVISVTQINAGDAFNVIPQAADMRGTVRTFSLAVREVVFARMTDVIAHVCAAMGCTGTFSYEHVTHPVINDPVVSAAARDVFKTLLPADALDLSVRTMGSEDMSEFMSDIPGMFFFLGAADPTTDTYYGHHHPRFSIDEEVLPLGVALLSSTVAAYVLP